MVLGRWNTPNLRSETEKSGHIDDFRNNSRNPRQQDDLKNLREVHVHIESLPVFKPLSVEISKKERS